MFQISLRESLGAPVLGYYFRNSPCRAGVLEAYGDFTTAVLVFLILAMLVLILVTHVERTESESNRVYEDDATTHRNEFREKLLAVMHDAQALQEQFDKLT